MVQWAWSYFSYQRAIRLITGGPVANDSRVAWAVASTRSPRCGALLPLPALPIERWYSRGVYPAPAADADDDRRTSFPFALFDVLWIGAVAAAAILVYRSRRDGMAQGGDSASPWLIALHGGCGLPRVPRGVGAELPPRAARREGGLRRRRGSRAAAHLALGDRARGDVERGLCARARARRVDLDGLAARVPGRVRIARSAARRS